jgi:hypothetical protein
MARTYHRDSKGRFAKSPGGSSGGGGGSRGLSVAKPSRAKQGSGLSGGRVIQNISTGRPISQEEAAAIMFGSGARKKIAGKKVRKRR